MSAVRAMCIISDADSCCDSYYADGSGDEDEVQVLLGARCACHDKSIDELFAS